MFLTNFFSEKTPFVFKKKKKVRRLIKELAQQENKELSFLNIIFCSWIILSVPIDQRQPRFDNNTIFMSFLVLLLLFVVLNIII